MIKGVDRNSKTIDGLAINISNLEQFHYKFLEAKYELEYFRYKRTVLEEEFSKADYEYEIEQQQRVEVFQKVVISLRKLIKSLYDTNSKYRASFDKQIKTDPIFFINNFIVSQDPRLKALGLSPKVPLILYPAQKKAIDDVMKAWKDRMGIATEKSRGEGGTEIYAALTVWFFITQNDIEISWGSRIIDSVDNKDDPNCIFERMRRMISYLPKQMTKNIRKGDDKALLIKNRLNNTTIVGGGGKHMARGWRSAISFIDEFSAIEHQEFVLSSVTGVTPTTVLLTTPQGRDVFYSEKESSGRIKTTLGWWMNPAKNKYWYTNQRPPEDELSFWYEAEKAYYNNNKTMIAQELDISYDSYVSDPVIPSLWVNAAINLEIPNPKKGKLKIGGLDISAGKHDKTDLCKRDGNLCEEVIDIPNVTTPVEGARKAAVICNKGNYNTIVYDQNGVGESTPELKKEFPNIDWIGEKGQRSPSNKFLVETGERAHDLYANRRAELWFNARKMFQKTFEHVSGKKQHPFEELVSIPDDPVLIADLTTPRILVYKEKMGVESKKDVRKELGRSPDKGDAFINAFSINKTTTKNTVLHAFDYKSENVFDGNINTNIAGKIYGCLYLTDTMQLFTTIGFFSTNQNKMYIFWAKQYDDFDVESVKKDIYGEFPNIASRIRWFGNKTFIETRDTQANSLWSLFARIGIVATEPYGLDNTTHLLYINEMFKKGQLQISHKLTNLLNHIQYLSFDRNGVEEKYILGLALIVLIAGFKPERARYEQQI